ncbi:GNAT family N-acetyltransferase [Oceanirhabdus seepicola]|uniref:GNAT family N-acetyltransferase n=1 Tax=Oceanirhabdus seepicola TaxID=2828781 RepID=A0A9J6P0R3_9CLOT|nr:GNAT family N-acetyltransferase [Oceanirhabdus seepicola]MCM1989048.1 GNAT family N-acetyltransferase [Oceanirhabdus seepicola]
MEFNKSKMIEIVRKQLAIDMNCNIQDFIKDGIVFCEAKSNEGRRMFDRQSPFLEIATMGKSTVVSADSDILTKVKPLLETKTREDIFVAPFLFGHSLYYIPDCDRIKKISPPDGFTFHIKEGKEIHKLYKIPGFENAIQYDINHPCPDTLVIYAMYGYEIVAMAGASADSSLMWQIGIDVLPKFRNKGLATTLVSNLAIMIMDRGIVPYYGTASSNIPSQSVAYRSGFIPTWMCSYKNTFDGTAPYELICPNINTILKDNLK